MTLGRVAELSSVLGFEPVFDLRPMVREQGANSFDERPALFSSKTESTSRKSKIKGGELEIPVP
jgi:hypothetical protein